MKISKRMLAVFLAVVLAVSMGVMSFAVNAADDDVILNGDEGTGESSLINDFSSYNGVADYNYLGFATLKDTDLATYKYLQMTYTGDITFLRFEFEKVANPPLRPPVKSAATWFNGLKDENEEYIQPKHFVTADGSAIALTVTEPTTIVIDLAASGIDLTKGYNGLHMHYGDGDKVVSSGGFEITDARLKKNAVDPTTDPSAPSSTEAPTAAPTEAPTAAPTEAPTAAPTEAPTEAPVVDFIMLNGDEKGLSSMMEDFSDYIGTGYQYLGFVTLKDADLTAYRYLQMTYTGDIYSLRMEFENVESGDKSAATWFNGLKDDEDKYIQPVHFVTTDGSEIPLNTTEPVTIVIDLAASGIDLTAGYDGIHMHYWDSEIESAGFAITSALLTKSAEIIDPNQQPTTETPTEETTATEPTTATTDKDGSNPQTGVAPVLPIAIALAASAGVIVLTAKKRK